MSIFDRSVGDLSLKEQLVAIGFGYNKALDYCFKPYPDVRTSVRIWREPGKTRNKPIVAVQLIWYDVKIGRRTLYAECNVDDIRRVVLKETGGIIDIVADFKIEKHPEGNYYL